MARLALTAVVHSEGGLYVAYCPEVGTVSQRRTVDEAVANLKEATELYLEGESSEAMVEFAPTVVVESAGEVA